MDGQDTEQLPSDLRFFLEEVGEALRECLRARLPERPVPPESKEEDDTNDESRRVSQSQ